MSYIRVLQGWGENIYICIHIIVVLKESENYRSHEHVCGINEGNVSKVYIYTRQVSYIKYRLISKINKKL
jgi:hypothetical protein